MNNSLALGAIAKLYGYPIVGARYQSTYHLCGTKNCVAYNDPKHYIVEVTKVFSEQGRDQVKYKCMKCEREWIRTLSNFKSKFIIQ